MDILYRLYYKQPCKHPSYREEWNKFWDVRACQLRREGVNVEKHDFTEEWRDFFLNRLKIMKKTEYEGVKDYLTRKYLKKSYRRKSRHRSSSSESNHSRRSYKKSSDRKSRKSRSSRRSFSTDYKRKKERRSRSVTPKITQYKFDVPSPISVTTVCRALLHLDKFVTFNRIRVSELLDKAQSEQIKKNREYLMNKSEYDFLKNLNTILLNILMLSRISMEIANDIKRVRLLIMDLIARWLQFYNDLKPAPSLYNVVKTEEIASSIGFKPGFINPPAVNKFVPPHETVIIQCNNFKNFNERHVIAKDLIKQGEIGSWEKMVAIKVEPIERPENHHESDVLKLMEEKNQILRKIYEAGEIQDPFNLINNSQDSIVNSSDDFKVAIKQESLPIAHEIPDEQLIEYLSELELLSEEKQNCLLHIMTEIENTDSERFEKLKGFIFKEDNL